MMPIVMSWLDLVRSHEVCRRSNTQTDGGLAIILSLYDSTDVVVFPRQDHLSFRAAARVFVH